MVDALRGIWRVLRSGGTLVDLRPVSARCAVEVLSSGAATRIGDIDAFGMAADDSAADAAARHVVEHGWFARRRDARFDLHFCWNEPEEMASYIETSTRLQRVLPSYDAVEKACRDVSAAGGGNVRLRCRRPFLMNVYAKSRSKGTS